MEEYKFTLAMELTDDYKKSKAGFDSGNEINSKVIPSTTANVGRGVIWN